MIYKVVLLSLFLLASCQTSQLREPSSTNRPPQFVLLAFDGSKSLDMWNETRSFAKQNDIKFTYFVSGVYFLADSDKSFYAEPLRGLGKSAIGWGGSRQEIHARNQQMVSAISEGHEIASHANAHFDGAKYSTLQWQMELKQFRDILRNGWELYNRKKPSSTWTNYFDQQMAGFRAPQLGHSQVTLNALSAIGYRYDTSKVGPMSYWPQKIGNIWNFPLAGLRISGSGKQTLSMDYNFYVADSNGKKGPSDQWPLYEQRMYETYIQYFKNNYFGNRAPVDIGHHFSQWNGGAYWKAMKRFAQTVCQLPEVECVTYRELTHFVDRAGAQQIASFQAGNFTKLDPSSVQLPVIPQKASSSKEGELSETELKALIDQLPPIPHDEDKVNKDIEI